MINNESQSFYVAIVEQSLHISYFGSKDGKSDYQKKYLMPDSFDDNLNLIILTKFISEKVKDYEINRYLDSRNLYINRKVSFSQKVNNCMQKPSKIHFFGENLISSHGQYGHIGWDGLAKINDLKPGLEYHVDVLKFKIFEICKYDHPNSIVNFREIKVLIS